jgi:hypothetical protein
MSSASGPTPPRHPPATDVMTCRACGRDERASEGYPCTRCGTFICVICNFRGIVLCKKCQTETGAPPTGL